MATKSYEEMTEQEREQDILDAIAALAQWNQDEQAEGKQEKKEDFWRHFHHQDPL